MGVTPYSDGLDVQAEAAGKVALLARSGGEASGMVFGLEHPAVVTLGKRGLAEADLRVSESELSERGVELFKTSRGGQATLHSEGQLVIYPVLPIQAWGIGARDLVCLLEKATIECLAQYGIKAHVGAEEPGLYTDFGKIAFFGLRISEGVSSHGLAINVRNDLGLFGLIRSCGRDHEKFDSLERCGIGVSVLELFETWCVVLTRHFEARQATGNREGGDQLHSCLISKKNLDDSKSQGLI